MNQLIIKLTGEIQQSNFDEWKIQLITQIQATKTELTTDEDFVIATRQVKSFKAAEDSLKEAKRTAIDQATDIRKLFAAIDEISEAARQARLSLERQIKARKLEIKNELIQSGIEAVRSFLDQQSDNFQNIDCSGYLDRNRFESAVRGKAGTKGMQFAIDNLGNKIKQEISEKADQVTNNVVTIDSLPSEYQLLFQDRNSLLELTKQELDLTIEKRIALFNERNTRIKAKKADNDLKKLDDITLNPDASLNSDEAGMMEKGKYRLILEILSTKETAIEIARCVKHGFGDNTSITSIRLTRDHDL